MFIQLSEGNESMGVERSKSFRSVLFTIFAAVFLAAGLYFVGCSSVIDFVHFLSVPLLLTYLLIFQPGFIRKNFLLYLILLVGFTLLVAVYFIIFSKAVAGIRINWIELPIAVYFLFSVFTIIFLFDKLLNLFLSFLMSVHREKNVLSTKLVLKNVLRAALMIFAVIPYLFAIFTTRWVKFYETTEVRDMLNMKSRQVFFEAADGTRLSGLVIQPPYGTSKCWVIIAPGRNLTKNFFLLHARIMSDNGYNILLLDLRGNGDSSGHKYSFGVNESDDIIAAADFIYKTNPESTSHIFAFGMDEGATAVVGAAAKDKRFSGAVVAGASGYEVALPGWLSDCLPGWLKNVILKETECVINFDIGQAVTGLEGLYEKISQISPRPVLVIDNLRNTTMDRLRAHQLYSKAKEPKMIWLTPEQTSGYQETELAGEYFAQILDLFSLGRTRANSDS